MGHVTPLLLILNPRCILHCNTPYAGFHGANPQLWNECTKAINICLFEGVCISHSQHIFDWLNTFTAAIEIMCVIVQSWIALIFSFWKTSCNAIFRRVILNMFSPFCPFMVGWVLELVFSSWGFQLMGSWACGVRPSGVFWVGDHYINVYE